MNARPADRDSPFAPALIIGAVLVGFIAFLAWLGLGAFEGDYRSGDDGREHALSKSAVGYSGLVTLLKGMGREAEVARESLRAPAMQLEPSMLIVTLDNGLWGGDIDDLPTVRGYRGPVLMVFPKWKTLPALRRGWVRQTGLEPINADAWLGPRPVSAAENKAKAAEEKKARDKPGPRAAPRIIVQTAQGKAGHSLTATTWGWDDEAEEEIPVVRTIQTGVIDRWRTFKAHPGWTPVVVDETGAAVLIVDEKSRRYALADPDLINNHGLAQIANARAGLIVLDSVAQGGTVYLDVTLHGLARTRSMLKLMLQPPFLGATLCALAAALMMIWHAIWRFGPAARAGREIALGKTALADNQAGLIRMSGRQHRMGSGYVAVVTGLVARAVAAPRDLAGEALEAFLDRLGKGRTQDSLSEISLAAGLAANNAQLMEAAQRLHRWRLEMTRDSR